MEMPTRYDPKEAEPRLQKTWNEDKAFKFDPASKKKIFSIDTPPRYASGPLHIGHATSYSHQDFAARYKRMNGFNVFYPLCFDVNGLPIEVNVEKTGVKPENVGREAFIKACSEFAGKNIGKMTDQFKALGVIMDDSIYYQTNEPYYRRLTQVSFLRLFEKGLVYKGDAPVNWCPRCVTALADAETEYKTRQTKLNYVKFYVKEKTGSRGEFLLEDEKGAYAVIATTRPELLPACVVVLINPDDERYKDLLGKTMITPVFNKEVKVMADESVDPKFGTGIVMVCTFGDLTDLEVVRKHKLPFIKALDEHGNLTEAAGKYAGMSTKEGRGAIINDMAGLLVKQEDLEQSVSACWRCATPIEYIITKEWFLKTLPFKKDILRLSKEIKWRPDYMEQRLINWTNSLSWDWCISRRRYFATPIPVWECEKCGKIIPAKEDECYADPLAKTKTCPKCGGEAKGNGMVFDTWMDSSITPLYNCFWQRDAKMFKRLYPMSLRPQAHDIIRTWAFYTILRCFQMTKEKPFENIAISAYIMGPDGAPMHASRGNVLDPLDVIEKNSADAFRYFAGLSTLGVDTAFRWKDVEHANKLLQKIWNVCRFAGMQLDGYSPKAKVKYADIDEWILSKAASTAKECTADWNDYNFPSALQRAESFLWHDIADNYLEIVKGRLYGKDVPSKKAAQDALYKALLTGVKLLAPILPHITEEVWQNLFRKLESDGSVHLSAWPSFDKKAVDKKTEEAGDAAVAIISAVRQWKQANKLPLNAELTELTIEADAKKKTMLKKFLTDIAATTKSKKVLFGKGDVDVPNTEMKITVSGASLPLKEAAKK
jgi:valyl-tRNA synthetase